MNKTDDIKRYARALRLPSLATTCDDLIHQAQIDAPSFLEFTESILKKEVEQRQKNDFEKRKKMAKLPCNKQISNQRFSEKFNQQFSDSDSRPDQFSSLHGV